MTIGACAMLMASFLSAQEFKIDTLQYQGTDQNIINFVILADGYTADEMQYFHDDAKKFTQYFFETEPFRQYVQFFNVYAIQTISEESGIVHHGEIDDCPSDAHGLDVIPERYNGYDRNAKVPKSNPKTIFGSSFDNYGIHRLVIAHNEAKIEEVLKNHIPNFTQSIILVNSPFYGGAGGKHPTATVNKASNDIAVHELGHSFGQLSDEYWAGNQYAVPGPNKSQEIDPENVPWKNWLGENGVGVYSYGATGSPAHWFRPHEFCKMQYLVAEFCSVCQEALVEKIHEKTNLIVSRSPENNQIDWSKNLHFKIKTLKPKPNTLQVEWFLNEVQIADQTDEIFLNKGLLKNGKNVLKAKVFDNTTLVRNEDVSNRSAETIWEFENPAEAKLEAPVLTWGNKMSACYNGHQVVSIKNPEAGVTYKWYDTKDATTAFAETANLILPKLTKNQTLFVESVHQNKKSDRVAVDIEVMDEIKISDKAKIKKLPNGKLSVTLPVSKKDKGVFSWQKEDGTRLPDLHSDEYFIWRKGNTNTIEVENSTTPYTILVKKVDGESTCSSETVKIIVK